MVDTGTTSASAADFRAPSSAVGTGDRDPLVGHGDVNALLGEAHTGRAEAGRSMGHLVVALALVAIPALIAFALANGQTEMFEGRVDVLHNVSGAEFGDIPILMANQTVRAERRDLAATVAEALGTTPDDLIDRRSVSLVVSDNAVESTVIRFAVRDEERQAAVNAAEAYAAAYIDEVGTEPVTETRADIDRRIGGLLADLDAAQDAIAVEQEAREAFDRTGLTKDETELQRADLDQRVTAANQRADKIRDALNILRQLRADEAPRGVTIAVAELGPGFAPTDPVSPQPKRSLALGLAVGLVLAATYLFAASQLRRR